MSTPEWMKKFQEIGQKGEEEVTGVGDGGFVKTAEARWTGPKPTNTGEVVTKSNSDESPEPNEVPNDTPTSPDPPERGVSLSNDDSPSGAASDDDSSSGAASSDGSSGGVNGSENAAENSEMQSSSAAKDEEIGESWVPDEDKVKNRASDGIDSDAAAAGRPSLNAGESFITEEILVDEDGNEILVDENGNEIHVDENGNEVHVDENGNEVQVDENGYEIQDAVDEVVVDEIVNRQGEDINTGEYDAMENESNKQPGAPIYDLEQQQEILGVGKKGNRSRMSWFIPILVFAMIVASALVVIFLVVYNEDRASYDKSPTMAPTSSNYLDADSSSGGVDAAATTEFDDIQNRCSSLGSLVQPNIVDQCECYGNVDTIAEDVRARWEGLLQRFIPSVYPDWSDPINSCSPENQALLWLSSGLNNGGEIDDTLRLQRYVLAVVYFAQGGTEWARSTNWLSEKNVCVWEGVECNDSGHVRILNLDQNQLTGDLSDAPTKLDSIEAYFASNNNLIGSIPDGYFNDSSLRYIDFSNNELSGGITSNISKESKLTNINLASNNLSGSIPSQISEIAGLEVLDIKSNSFSGTLPSSLFTLPLTKLSIGGNEFSGTIPENISDVSTLTSLTLGPNMFTGDLTTGLSELTALNRLSIMGIPDLSGRLPVEYGLKLTNLVELSIADTNVEGDIPDQYGMMTVLETFHLSNNKIRGNIPPSLSLLTNLKSLSLNGNFMTGMIPSEMGLLSSLEELQLHSNNFWGSIPNEIGNLLNIRTLKFDGNVMDGRAPFSVCALRDFSLEEFVVDCPTLVGQNKVEGIICSIPDCCTNCV